MAKKSAGKKAPEPKPEETVLDLVKRAARLMERGKKCYIQLRQLLDELESLCNHGDEFEISPGNVYQFVDAFADRNQIWKSQKIARYNLEQKK